MPYLQHALAGAILLFYGILALAAPRLCESLAQEDSWIEWLTFGFFFISGAVFGFLAMRWRLKKGWFALGLCLFCLGVAGEEISWGQRMIGFMPPKIFLERNLQQEFNIHNLFQNIAKPKWLNVFVLIGWGVLGPVVVRIPWSRPFFDRLPLILPSLWSLPWFAAGAAILILYPAKLTGEYMELLTGALFFSAALPLVSSSRLRGIFLVLPVLVGSMGVGYVELQARVNAEEKIACAHAETRALAEAVSSEGAERRLLDMGRVHKRVFSAVRKGYLRQSLGKALEEVRCDGAIKNPLRRSYFMDPWAEPYWFLLERRSAKGPRRAAFYSFGPNRRRDGVDGRFEDTDDIVEWTESLAPAKENVD